jgi:hypothetical protein
MMVHSFKLENYFPKSAFWSQFFISKAVKIVCVSNAIEKEVKLKFDLKNIRQYIILLTFLEQISGYCDYCRLHLVLGDLMKK